MRTFENRIFVRQYILYQQVINKKNFLRIQYKLFITNKNTNLNSMIKNSCIHYVIIKYYKGNNNNFKFYKMVEIPHVGIFSVLI